MLDGGNCVGNDILSTSTLRRKLFSHLSEDEEEASQLNGGKSKNDDHKMRIKVSDVHCKKVFRLKADHPLQHTLSMVEIRNLAWILLYGVLSGSSTYNYKLAPFNF